MSPMTSIWSLGWLFCQGQDFQVDQGYSSPILKEFRFVANVELTQQ
jgi:hypothetical protein